MRKVMAKEDIIALDYDDPTEARVKIKKGTIGIVQKNVKGTGLLPGYLVEWPSCLSCHSTQNIKFIEEEE